MYFSLSSSYFPTNKVLNDLPDSDGTYPIITYSSIILCLSFLQSLLLLFGTYILSFLLQTIPSNPNTWHCSKRAIPSSNVSTHLTVSSQSTLELRIDLLSDKGACIRSYPSIHKISNT